MSNYLSRTRVPGDEGAGDARSPRGTRHLLLTVWRANRAPAPS
ncbi:hypothetical protein CURTO8I2_200076 [Curtobacterium sp. 8I-2]|nr:hypothetical protein CURTO8I2_200076 [Curtobacterium sp. 8I-2]